MTLRVENLTCWRGKQALFDRLSFTLEPKKLLLVEGSNGCGKTTLLKILAGLRPPTSGLVTWQQTPLDAMTEEYNTHLKWLGHDNGMSRHLSVIENLRINANLFACEAKGIETVLHQIGLKPFQDTLVKHLSAGMKRRLALARLMLGHSSLWILDEPQTSLDKAGVALFESLTSEFLDQGGSVVIASHQPLGIAPNYIQRLNLSACH
mgnify:CR=1 FL=1|jgi:heme exporter protein A